MFVLDEEIRYVRHIIGSRIIGNTRGRVKAAGLLGRKRESTGRTGNKRSVDMGKRRSSRLNVAKVDLCNEWNWAVYRGRFNWTLEYTSGIRHLEKIGIAGETDDVLRYRRSIPIDNALKVNDLQGGWITYVSVERDWALSKWPPDLVMARKSLGRAVAPMYLEVGNIVSEKERTSEV